MVMCNLRSRTPSGSWVDKTSPNFVRAVRLICVFRTVRDTPRRTLRSRISNFGDILNNVSKRDAISVCTTSKQSSLTWKMSFRKRPSTRSGNSFGNLRLHGFTMLRSRTEIDPPQTCKSSVKYSSSYESEQNLKFWNGILELVFITRIKRPETFPMKFRLKTILPRFAL